MQRCLRCSLKTVVLNYEKEDFKNFCKVEKYVVKKLTHKKLIYTHIYHCILLALIINLVENE